MFSRMRDVYGLACARHHSGRVTRDQRAAQTGNLRNSGFARQLLVDARADFRRIGVAHGEAWTCLELAVIDAGNNRPGPALALCDEATALFASYDDRRGGDWSRFLRCTLLPYAAAPAAWRWARRWPQEELAELLPAPVTARATASWRTASEAFALMLERGVSLEAGWQAWQLGMVPNRHAREVMGVPVAVGTHLTLRRRPGSRAAAPDRGARGRAARLSPGEAGFGADGAAADAAAADSSKSTFPMWRFIDFISSHTPTAMPRRR